MKYQLIVFSLLINQIKPFTLCSGISWAKNATTVAGSANGTGGSDATTLFFPFDIYLLNDSVYVSDSQNYRVQLWYPNATSGITVINGSYGQKLNQFKFILDIDIDDQNNIYILDADNHRITKWRPFGKNGTIVAGGNGKGIASNKLNFPEGMYIQKSSLTIWIADTDNHRIVKWTSRINSSVVCGSEGIADNQFNSPSGIFIDENDGNTMYIADCYNHRIQKWLSGATSGTTVAGVTNVTGADLGHLYYPNKVIVDQYQYMYIIDELNSRVLRWKIGESSGELIAGDSTGGVASNQLNYAISFRFGSDGSLYVADTYNNRTQKFQSYCPITTTKTTITAMTTTTTTSAVLTTTSNGITNIGSIFIVQIIFLIILFHY